MKKIVKLLLFLVLSITFSAWSGEKRGKLVQAKLVKRLHLLKEPIKVVDSGFFKESLSYWITITDAKKRRFSFILDKRNEMKEATPVYPILLGKSFDGAVKLELKGANEKQLFDVLKNWKKSCKGKVSSKAGVAALYALSLLESRLYRGKGGLVPVMEVPLSGEDSVIYCATFQLAWDELKTLNKGPVFVENPPTATVYLNARKLPEDVVSPSVYIAVAGDNKSAVWSEVGKRLKTKFGKDLSDLSFSPSPERGFLAFSYLYQRLTFAQKFSRSKRMGLHFGAQKVPVTFFGCSKKTAELYADQVKVLGYKDRDDFTLQLNTRVKGEYVVLSKMARPKSLKAAVEKAKRAIDNPDPGMKQVEKGGKRYSYGNQIGMSDTLKIPVLKFNTSKEFHTFTRKPIVGGRYEGRRLARVFQKVKFLLNESGATLESEVGMEDN